MLVERAIGGIQAQEVAFLRDPFFTLGAGWAYGEDEVEGAALQGGDLLILDGRGIAQTCKLGAGFGVLKRGADAVESGYVFDIEIQEIAVVDAVRQVGAGVI